MQVSEALGQLRGTLEEERLLYRTLCSILFDRVLDPRQKAIMLTDSYPVCPDAVL